MMFGRRKALGVLAAAPAAVPYVESAMQEKMAQSIGAKLAGANALTPASWDPIRSAAHKALHKINHSAERQCLYRRGHHYDDLAELRSVSPAAKRFISAGRLEAEQKALRAAMNPFERVLGYISGEEVDD